MKNPRCCIRNHGINPAGLRKHGTGFRREWNNISPQLYFSLHPPKDGKKKEKKKKIKFQGFVVHGSGHRNHGNCPYFTGQGRLHGIGFHNLHGTGSGSGTFPQNQCGRELDFLITRGSRDYPVYYGSPRDFHNTPTEAMENRKYQRTRHSSSRISSRISSSRISSSSSSSSRI